jgi:hypothetical protein
MPRQTTKGSFRIAYLSPGAYYLPPMMRKRACEAEQYGASEPLQTRQQRHHIIGLCGCRHTALQVDAGSSFRSTFGCVGRCLHSRIDIDAATGKPAKTDLSAHLRSFETV